MNHIRRWATVGLIMAALSACGGPAPNTDDAARTFLTERNGGTPVATSGNAMVMGMIERIDGDRLTVKSPLQGTAMVQLSEVTQVRKQTKVEQSAIGVGTNITAFGTQTGDTLAADALQLGDGGALAGGGVVPVGGNGTTKVGPPAVEPAANGGGDQIVASEAGSGPVSGTVAEIDQRKLTVKRDDGSLVFVQLSDTTEVYQQAEVERTELNTGIFIAVTGDRNADIVSAQTIEILPPPSKG